MNAERLKPQPNEPLLENSLVTVRIENLRNTKINTNQLRYQRLKIKPLAVHQNYIDTKPDDLKLVVKIDLKEGGFAEGDIIQAEYITHGGPAVTSVYHDEVKLEAGFNRSLTVVHFEEVEQGDPKKIALFHFVKTVFKNEDGVEISDEEAWRLANKIDWSEEFTASATQQILGHNLGVFHAKYSLGQYFSFLKSMYQGQNSVTDDIISDWLPFAEKIAKMYEKMPEDTGKSWEEAIKDRLNEILGNSGSGGGFDIHEYIPRIRSKEEMVVESMTSIPTTFMVIGPNTGLKEPLKFWLGRIHYLLRETSTATKTQLDFFQQLPEKDMTGISPAKGLKMKYLSRLVDSIEEFKKDPVQYLFRRDKTLYENFTKAGDKEQALEMGQLVIKINELPESTIKLYNDGNIFALEVALAGTELTVEDLKRFDRHFKYEALGKAFTMLDENEKLVDQEIEQIQDNENLDYVVSVIKSRKKEMRVAAKDLKEGLILFHQVMPRNKQSNLNIYLNSVGMNPNEVLETVARKHNVDKSEIVSLVGMRGGNYSDYHFSVLTAARGYIREMLLIYGGAMAHCWQNYKATGAIRRTDIFPLDSFDDALLRNFLLSPDYPMMFTSKEYNQNLDNFFAICFPQFERAEQAHKEAAAHYSGSNSFIRKDGKKVTFNILKDLTFNYARISQYSDKQIREALKNKLQEKKENVGTVRGYLHEDTEYVYEMAAVLEYAMEANGILQGTNASKIIYDKLSDINAAKMWTSIGIGALSLVLAIGGFFTGGATTALGLALLAGSITLGIADLVIENNRYQFGRAVSNTALNEANELGKIETSYLGVALAIVGLVADGLQFISAFLKLTKGAKLVAMDAKFGEDLFEQLVKKGDDFILLKDGRKMYKKEFLKRFEDAAAKYGPDMQASKAFQEFATIHNIAPISRPGLFALMKSDPEAFEMLLKMDAKLFHPGALSKIGMQLVLEERIAGSLGETIRFFNATPEVTAKIINAYAGVNGKYLGNLPDVWKVINGTDAVKYPKLVEKILQDPLYQSKILADQTALPQIVKRWESWINPPKNKPHTSENFEDFLKTGRNAITFEKTPGKTIVEHFANDLAKLDLFSQPGNFRGKNLAVLGTTEKSMVDAIENGTFLPGNANLQRRLNEVLDEDLIGATTDLQAARTKIVSEINTAIGSNLKNVDEFEKALDLVTTSGSRGSIGESFFRKVMAGVKTSADNMRQVLFKLDWLPGAAQGLRIDFIRPVSRRLLDIKTGYSVADISKDQLKSIEIVLQQSKIKGSKVFDFLAGLGINGELKGADFLFLPTGKGTSKVAAESAYKLVKNTTADPDNFKIFFADESGKIFQYLGPKIDPKLIGTKLPD